MSYEVGVKEMLGGINYTHKRKLCRCTVRYGLPNGDEKIRFWHTDILTFHPDGTVNLSLNGWWTSTTVMRVNRYLGKGYVWQRRGKHFYSSNGDGKTYFYQEGMLINAYGVPLSAVEYIPYKREASYDKYQTKW
jgi:hypothetical protein